jgi:hypothetical protein
MACPNETTVDLLPMGELDDPAVLTTTIPRNARDCYELFCDVTRVPEWLRVVAQVRVHSRTPTGRPREVSFLARLRHGLIGYTLAYVYRDDNLEVWWTITSAAQMRVVGAAQFAPLGPRATLMTYDLTLDLGDGALPAWDDALYEGHPPSAALNDFRDFALRML